VISAGRECAGDQRDIGPRQPEVSQELVRQFIQCTARAAGHHGPVERAPEQRGNRSEAHGFA
jgi:hypothetical protein